MQDGQLVRIAETYWNEQFVKKVLEAQRKAKARWNGQRAAKQRLKAKR